MGDAYPAFNWRDADSVWTPLVQVLSCASLRRTVSKSLWN